VGAQATTMLKKRSHNHNNNQTNPKPQPNTKNKPTSNPLKIHTCKKTHNNNQTKKQKQRSANTRDIKKANNKPPLTSEK
jgi:hypothetical protein